MLLTMLALLVMVGPLVVSRKMRELCSLWFFGWRLQFGAYAIKRAYHMCLLMVLLLAVTFTVHVVSCYIYLLGKGGSEC